MGRTVSVKIEAAFLSRKILKYYILNILSILKQTNGRTDERMNGRMDERTKERTHERTKDEGIDGRRDEQTNGRTDERNKINILKYFKTLNI